MVANVKTRIKQEFKAFNRTLGKKALGEGEIVEGINALHERLGPREFYLSYGKGKTGLRLLASHIRTVLAGKRGPRPVIIGRGEGVRLRPGTQQLGRGLTAVTMKSKRGREMFIMRKSRAR